MQPRIVFRTHYQVDEPVYLTFLVKYCTSPVQSTYREIAAQKLALEIRRRNGELNKDAGGYAVDLAADLGLITGNNSWTEKGILIDLITEDKDGILEEQLKLSLAEKLLFFRIFLEADGAAFIFLAQRLIEIGEIPNSEAARNKLAKEMFVSIFSEYLRQTDLTADRVELRRKIDRINTLGYSGKSGNHKLFIHLQTLFRLGLVLISNSDKARIYHKPPIVQGEISGLEILLNEIPDIFSLEKVIYNHKTVEVGSRVLQISHILPTEIAFEPITDKIIEFIVPIYRCIMSTGIPLCPLSCLIEAIQVNSLAHNSKLLTYDDVMKFIISVQKQIPKDIHFHVDRRGQPAFVKLSDNLLRVDS